jgi:VIT1/CCC1 family predicted Fe2+/Mn2+ transporter
MRTLFASIKTSFKASFGDIVFGMEDGTVSIFGLVFGVAMSTNDTRAVLVAGMTGAVAAAVSMMAGAYLDVETASDQARLAATAENQEFAFDSAAMAERLRVQGLSAGGIDALRLACRDHPELPGALRSLFTPRAPAADAGPLGHALWMFVSDLAAALVPVVPFALLPIDQARWASIACTAVVLIALGIGRAKIGRRPLISTTLRTLAIAAAAGIAGVVVGHLVS